MMTDNEKSELLKLGRFVKRRARIMRDLEHALESARAMAERHPDDSLAGEAMDRIAYAMDRLASLIPDNAEAR